MKKLFNVIGIGEILWDLLPQGKVIGGAPANFAYHASELGARGYAVSAVGNDPLGDEIINTLSSYSIDLRLQRTDYPTGTVKVSLNDEGIPEYEITRNVAWDYISLTNSILKLARNADAVCFGSLAQRNVCSRETITGFMKNVPDASLKVFDINLRQDFYSKELIDDSLKLSNILKINDEELEIVSQLFGISGTLEERCMKLIGAYNLRILALTCGTKGSYLFRDGETSFMVTPVVEVKDTVGAGDSFTAGMVMGLLNNKSLKQCHLEAVNLAAYVCTQHGAMPPYISQLQRLIETSL